MQAWAERLLLGCRRELTKTKMADLRKRCAETQDEMERAQRDVFAKLRGNYEEKNEEKRAESLQAQKELEQAERFLAEAEEKLAEMAANDILFVEESLSAEETALLFWCRQMELAYEAILWNNRCMDEGEAARLSAYSGPGDREKNMVFQRDMAVLMEKMEAFLSSVGRIRYLPGMRMKTAQGTRRNLIMNGKTMLFFRKNHSVTEIDLLDFDLTELYGSWAVGDTLERKLKELRALELLFSRIIEESLPIGEELLREGKRQMAKTEGKDIFGFEKEEKTE